MTQKINIITLIVIFIAISFTSGISWGGPLEDLQPGHWYEVPNSNLADVLPDPLPPGYTGPTSIMIAWNSGAYDTQRDRLIVWGGGHGDYAGNEIYTFDINTLTWERTWGPTPNSQIRGDSSTCFDTYLDGNPVSVHTYDGIEYIPTTDRFWSQGGSRWCGPGGGGEFTWEFNFNTLEWQQRSDAPDSMLGVVSAYDPITGHVFQQGISKFSEYNPFTGTYSVVGNEPSGGWWEDRMTGAIDPERRLFVAVGQGHVRVWNIDTKQYSEISTTGGSEIVNADAPGFEYDPVIKKFVAWPGGGSTIYSLAPDTWIWTEHPPSNNNSVAPEGNPASKGPYGKFRYIPSKNAYITVNSINKNVFFYKLSEGGGTTPPPSGQINIPLKTWMKRDLPASSVSVAHNMKDSKHIRLAHNSDNGRIYFQGGDYNVPESGSGGVQYLLSYNIYDDEWFTEHDYCIEGGIQPMHPDQVGWVYDTNRKIFWMIPGYQGADAGLCPQSTLVKNEIMTFDPNIIEWNLPNRNEPSQKGEANGFAQYDPVTDSIIQMVGSSVNVYDIIKNTWTNKIFNEDKNGVQIAGIADWRGYTALDVENRVIYFISVVESRLYKYYIDTKELEFLKETPIPTWPQSGNALDRMMPVWDSVNKVILFPLIFDNTAQGMKFYIYHPDTNLWEEDIMNQPQSDIDAGIEIRGNAAVFDSNQNVLIVMGGRKDDSDNNPPSNPYIFLYRYGNGGGTTPPTYECNNLLDDDGDDLTDYPADPGCSSATDNDEYNAPDTTPPGITSVKSSGLPTQVTVVFTEAIKQSSAENISNYDIDKGITISAASLGSDLKTVTLTTSNHQEGITYALRVNNIQDRANIPNTIAPNTEKTYTYTIELVISNLNVTSGKTYEVIKDGMAIGGIVYIDRGYAFTSVSAQHGSTYIKTANDDKTSNDQSFLTFNVNQDVIVYIAHDDRIPIKPSWLTSFSDTGNNIITNDATLSLYTKDFTAGTVVLGGNENAESSMYSVIIREQGTGTTNDITAPSPPTSLRRSEQ